jgi:hypothetical protein
VRDLEYLGYLRTTTTCPRAPAMDNNNEDKFANVGGGGGGGGGGPRTSSGMIINPLSVRAAIKKEDVRDGATAQA